MIKNCLASKNLTPAQQTFRFFRLIVLSGIILLYGNFASAQNDSILVGSDSINTVLMQEFNQRLAEIEQQRIADSIRKAELEKQIISLTTTDNLKKEELQRQLEEIESHQKKLADEKRNRIDSLRATAVGFPVYGAMDEILFHIYTKIGALTPNERA